MTHDLHLAAIHLDFGRVVREIRRARLPPHVDDDYLLHLALEGLFGRGVIRPFAPDTVTGRTLRVLGYTSLDAQGLREHASLSADPELAAACDWDRLATRPMKTNFASGTRLGFELRVCPTVRKGRGATVHAAGAEVDAFVAQAHELGADAPLSREAVYTDWLRGRLASHGATLESAALKRFQLARQVRRTQGEDRRARDGWRPDATLSGELTVTDPVAFQAAIGAGIGRQRGFGFGMLRLRPPTC